MIVSVDIKGTTQNVPTVEIELAYSWDQIAEGAGTTIGTLMDAKAKYMTLGCKPNPEHMKELSTTAETLGYDGSMEDVVVVDAEVVTGTVKDPLDESLDHGEFSM